MAKIAAEFQVPSVLMHNKNDTIYDIDIIESMKKYFDKSIELALKNGMERSEIQFSITRKSMSRLRWVHHWL